MTSTDKKLLGITAVTVIVYLMLKNRKDKLCEAISGGGGGGAGEGSDSGQGMPYFPTPMPPIVINTESGTTGSGTDTTGSTDTTGETDTTGGNGAGISIPTCPRGQIATFNDATNSYQCVSQCVGSFKPCPNGLGCYDANDPDGIRACDSQINIGAGTGGGGTSTPTITEQQCKATYGDYVNGVCIYTENNCEVRGGRFENGICVPQTTTGFDGTQIGSAGLRHNKFFKIFDSLFN